MFLDSMDNDLHMVVQTLDPTTNLHHPSGDIWRCHCEFAVELKTMLKPQPWEISPRIIEPQPEKGMDTLKPEGAGSW